MSYNSGIPLVTDPILRSQRQIKANFQSINEAWATNHIPLSASKNAGMHNILTLRPQGSDPTTTSTEVALYQKLVNDVPNIFFGPASSATPIQMTYPSISTSPNTATPPVYPTSQYTFSAGPFIIYGGYIANPTQGQTVTLSPGTTLIYIDLIMTNIVKEQEFFVENAIPTSISGTSFNISYPSSAPAFSPKLTFDVYYFAIGL